jgi:hypothetical protein
VRVEWLFALVIGLCSAACVEDPGPVIVCGTGGSADVAYITCISYPEYAGYNAPCSSVADCPAAAPECEIPVCENGTCKITWHEQDAHPCEGPGFTCKGSYCCGPSGDPS